MLWKEYGACDLASDSSEKLCACVHVQRRVCLLVSIARVHECERVHMQAHIQMIKQQDKMLTTDDADTTTGPWTTVWVARI